MVFLKKRIIEYVRHIQFILGTSNYTYFKRGISHRLLITYNFKITLKLQGIVILL